MGPPPGAQQQLEAYLDTHNLAAEEVESLLAVKRSWRPGAFAQAMSRHTYGSNYYFGSFSSTDTLSAGEVSRPAPFPVTDLWCTTLVNAAGQTRFVLVAQHEDMHVAEWIVHEPASPTQAQTLCP